jgi:RNA polymerase sigma-70 factor (ECF subfamily)
VGAWLGSREHDRAVIDEVKQRVRARALVARDGAPPRIADYAGRGPLGAWTRVIAIREHANLHRGTADGLDAAIDRGGGGLDGLDDLARTGELAPELVALRARHRDVVTAGFRAAITALPARARTLLRLCYVDGATLDAIGRMYGVNKSTVSRWLAAARADVLDGARAHVRAALALPAHDVDSLLGAMPRDLEISLHGLL